MEAKDKTGGLKMKLKGLKKAIGDFNRANAGGYYSPSYGKLMLNTSTGEIWTDEFYSLGHNSWIEYHDKDIINLGNEMNDYDWQYNTETAITMKNVKAFCKIQYGIGE